MRAALLRAAPLPALLLAAAWLGVGRARAAQVPCLASAPAEVVRGSDAVRARAFSRAVDECMAAMHARMHAALDTAATPDGAFAAAMIPHHQGAVDMARQILVYGRDPEMRAFARGVIVEQQAEIEQLRRWAERRPATTPERR